MSSKRAVTVGVGVAIIAAGAIAFFAVNGFPPGERGAEGTVGAAARYQAPQIATSDVQVTDAEIQEFLQSDTFDRLIKEKALHPVFASAAAREALARPGVIEALARPGVMESLARPGVMEALARPAVMESLARAGVMESLARPAVMESLAKAGVMDALARPAVMESLA